MHIPGHLAVALAQHTLPPFRASKSALAALLAASLIPDVIDKTIGYVLHLLPSGRHVAHNVFALTGSTALVLLVWNRATAIAWFAGYLGHLLADFNSRLPWFFPLKPYPLQQKDFNFNWPRFFRELLLLATVGAFYWFSHAAEIKARPDF